jgi:uncharacterized protein
MTNAESVARVHARLEDIRSGQNVFIPLAVESGSRAWGFPSPDSDYDCRFIFIRPIEQYLSPWQRRDVIETPIEGELDVNGWELGKAIKLLLKGNAVIIEWLTSPISYVADERFREDFLMLARSVADRDLQARHYLHLGERQRRVYFGDGRVVPQKKIFYALRPAAALRWLRHHPDQAVAPMHFPSLLEECDTPKDVMSIISDLLARKAETRELGSEPLPRAIAGFIDSEFALARENFPTRPRLIPHEFRERADEFFLSVVRRFNEKR